MNQTTDMKAKLRPSLRKKSPLRCILQLFPTVYMEKVLAELM